MKRMVSFLLALFYTQLIFSQCLSSVNPVGGTSNLLALPSKTLRAISFYKYNYGDTYFEKSKPSDFDLIESASYNYLGAILGYGITSRLTLETEMGYFINKTQHYDIEPARKVRGYGFSNFIVSARYGIYTNNQRRIYYSASTGLKIPSSFNYQIADGVELPEEVQSSIGSYGMVFQSFLVKEYSLRGLRLFLTNRFETNRMNHKDFKLGNSFYTSLFISKHLMFQWLKGDWTTILQIRNEIRAKNTRYNEAVEASGGIVFLLSPQINCTIKETWNISVMCDFPVYQYLNGIQLGTLFGLTFGVSRDIDL
ncbi:MAG: hypothetical protein JW723_05255 [Bacteroidales bacterium]|nr:hypothetical protein [Bacteroidales bacterium]